MLETAKEGEGKRAGERERDIERVRERERDVAKCMQMPEQLKEFPTFFWPYQVYQIQIQIHWYIYKNPDTDTFVAAGINVNELCDAQQWTNFKRKKLTKLLVLRNWRKNKELEKKVPQKKIESLN